MAHLRDSDSAEIAFRSRAAGYALIVGAVGAAVGMVVFQALLLGLLAGAGVAAIVYFGSLWIAERSGRAAASIYHPSGSSTPAVREYSFPDSLVVRGHIAEAVVEYQRLSTEFPADPEPQLRRARVLRDHVRDYGEAAAAFRAVLTIGTLKPETELAVLRELVELHVHKDKDPPRALPYLARIAQKFADTTTGRWAREEMATIKQTMQRET